MCCVMMARLLSWVKAIGVLLRLVGWLVGWFGREPEHYCGLTPVDFVPVKNDSSDGSRSVRPLRTATVGRRRVRAGEADTGTAEPMSASSFRVSSESESEGAALSQMDVDPVDTRPRSLKRPMVALGDLLTVRCSAEMNDLKEGKDLVSWRQWWGATAKGTQADRKCGDGGDVSSGSGPSR